MARTKKTLLPMDAAIAEYLRVGIYDSGLVYRQIAAATGMSTNRIGTILRKEPPPATVGEIGMLASVIGTTAAELVERAEAAMEDRSATVHSLDARRPTIEEQEVPAAAFKSSKIRNRAKYQDDSGFEGA